MTSSDAAKVDNRLLNFVIFFVIDLLRATIVWLAKSLFFANIIVCLKNNRRIGIIAMGIVFYLSHLLWLYIYINYYELNCKTVTKNLC